MKVGDGRSALNHGSPFGSQISKKSPETLNVSFDGLEKGEYYIEIYANSFWKTTCKKPLRSEIFSL